MQPPKATTAPHLLPAARLITLADNLKIDIDDVLGNQIACFGIPGSGKTNAAALLAEQVGAYFVPVVIFDREGDFASLVEVLPRAILATFDNCPTGADVMTNGLQVVYNLQSWPNDDQAASAIVTIVQQLATWSESQPVASRVPCLIVLDEAEAWLPERPGTLLSKDSYAALRDTFHHLASRGRKRGLTPALFSQRISELAKSVLQPGLYILMQQTLDTDLDRYMSYINRGDLTREQMRARIAAFKPGRAIVKLPNGAQKLVRLHPRQSAHISHTPRAQAAMNRYAALPFDAGQHYGPASAETITGSDAPAPRPGNHGGHYGAKIARVRELLTTHPELSSSEIAKRVGCDPSTVTRARQREKR